MYDNGNIKYNRYKRSFNYSYIITIIITVSILMLFICVVFNLFT